MVRYILIIFLLFTFSLHAQEHVALIDSTFHFIYIDETYPHPFSPVLSVTFGIPDSARVTVQLHKVLSNSNSLDTMETIPVLALVDTVLTGGKYRVTWNHDDKQKIITNKEDRFVYYLYIYRKVRTLYGWGYIKIEAKSKITSLNY